MYDVYRENTVYVLNAIEPLRSGLDGKTVITSDHGELLGEGLRPLFELLSPRWPIHQRQKFNFGHYGYSNTPELREVPWFELPFENRRKITTEEPVDNEFDETSIEEQLKALGYR